MLQVALAQVRLNARRFIAVGLAVMLGVGFLSATLMVGATSKASLRESVGESFSRADLVVNGSGDAFSGEKLTGDAVETVAAVDGVRAVHATTNVYADLVTGASQTTATLTGLAPPELESSELTAGTFPGSNSEVAIDETSAERLGVQLGDVVGVSSFAGLPDTGVAAEEAGADLTVVGLTAPSNDPLMAGAVQLLAVNSVLSTVAGSTDAGGGSTIEHILVSADPTTDPAVLAASIDKALQDSGGSSVTRTAEEQTTEVVSALSGGEDQLTLVLLAFAVVAVLVSALVISNTFSVLVAQRTRELALLRCLGAERRQIRNSVVVEAAVVGAVSATAGVTLAIGVMWALVEITGRSGAGSFITLAVPVSAVITGLVTGLVMTTAAALVPARAATAVAPLAAMRPTEGAAPSSRRGKFRLLAGGVIALIGIALLTVGALGADLLVALPGGVLSFLGILMCASLLVPAVVAAFGRLARPLGVPGRLAAVNAVRNPARTSATAAALIVGVTLVTMMMAGAQTTRVTLEEELARSYPVDLQVSGVGLVAQLKAVSGALAELDNVESLTVLSPAAVTASGQGEGQAGQPVYSAAPAELAEVLRSTNLELTDEVIIMPLGSGIPELTVEGRTGSVTLKVVEAGSRSFTPLMSSSTAAELGGFPEGIEGFEDPLPNIWLKLTDNLDAAEVTALQGAVVGAAGVSEYQVSGAALERVAYNEVIDVLLLIVTAMLAVAVLIALIGVANTLSLSVLERTRENSLLRALGLTRGQLRGMLAVEAVLIAGVAAVLGTLLGVLYGWLGAQAALGEIATVIPSVPWTQLLGVVAAAICAGLLASVLPARRAARLSPVEGLAIG